MIVSCFNAIALAHALPVGFGKLKNLANQERFYFLPVYLVATQHYFCYRKITDMKHKN